MPKSPEKRREAYRKLREAGFTAKEASRLKDASESKIEELLKLVRETKASIETPQKSEIKPKSFEPDEINRIIKNIPSRTQRNERMRYVNKILKMAGVPTKDRQRLRNASEETIELILRSGRVPANRNEIPFSTDIPRNYIQRYNVVVEIIFRDEAGKEIPKFVTITSNWKPTKSDIRQAVEGIVEDSADLYPDFSFIEFRIAEAWENTKRPERERPAGGYAGKYVQKAAPSKGK